MAPEGSERCLGCLQNSSHVPQRLGKGAGEGSKVTHAGGLVVADEEGESGGGGRRKWVKEMGEEMGERNRWIWFESDGWRKWVVKKWVDMVGING